MRISYNKLQKLMIDNQMKRQDLMRAAEISSSVATKLNKNETVSLGGEWQGTDTCTGKCERTVQTDDCKSR